MARSKGYRSQDGTNSETRYGGLARANPDGRASFVGADGRTLAAALDYVIDAGDLVSLSRTRDGGAICLYIRSGEETVRAYASTLEELDALLRVLAG